MASHIDLIDMNFVRLAQDRARRMGSPSAEMNFAALKDRLAKIRSERGLPESERSVAVVARDFDNRGQDALTRAISAHFAVWEVDFRHAYVSRSADEPRPSERTNPAEEFRSPDRTPQSLSHWLTYMCGLVAASQSPSLVVVSGAFELAGPLGDLVTRASGSRVILAFFQRLLNKRWIDNGLLDGRIPVEFVNLERHAMELLGADLRELVRASEAAQRPSSLPI